MADRRVERVAARHILTLDDVELPKAEVQLVAVNTTNMLIHLQVPFYMHAFHRSCAKKAGLMTFKGIVKVKTACGVCGRTIARRKPRG